MLFYWPSTFLDKVGFDCFTMRCKRLKRFLSPLNLFIFCMLFSANSVANTRLNLVAFESCPYVCADSRDRGVLVEIIDTIFKQQGMLVNIQVVPLQRALRMVKSASADGIIGVLAREVPELVIPQQPIGKRQYVMYVAADDNWFYSGLSSLQSRRIGVEAGASYGIANSYINRYSNGGTLIRKLSGQNIIQRKIDLLENKRINMFLLDSNKLQYYRSKYPQIQLNIAGFLPPDNIYIAFNQDSERAQLLTELVDHGMKKLRASGRLGAISSKYGLTDWQDVSSKQQAVQSEDYINRLQMSYKPSLRVPSKKKIEFASSVQPGSGYWLYALKFKALLEEYSQGKLSVSLNFANLSEHNIVMDISTGQIHMGMVASNNFTPYAPSLGFLNLPYLFTNIEQAKALFTDPLMQELSSLAALESNVRPLSFFIGGHRFLINSEKVVKTSKDLKGLKVRVPQNQLMVETFRAWGIEPYPLPWPDLYPALHAGIINATENPINIMLSGIKIDNEPWRFIRHITTLRYFLFTAPHLISESFFRSLSLQEQQMVQQAAQQAQLYIWQEMQLQEAESIKLAKSKGVIFTEPEKEFEDWQAKAKTVWSKFYYHGDGQALINEIQQVINSNKE